MSTQKFKIGDRIKHKTAMREGVIIDVSTAKNWWLCKMDEGDVNWDVQECNMEHVVTNQVTMETSTGEQEILTVKPLRLKALATNRDSLLAILMLNQHANKTVQRFPLHVVDSSSLPEDIAIYDIIWSPMTQQFLILIQSESFSEVASFMDAPVLDLPMETWTVAKVQSDQIVVSAAQYAAYEASHMEMCKTPEPGKSWVDTRIHLEALEALRKIKSGNYTLRSDAQTGHQEEPRWDPRNPINGNSDLASDMQVMITLQVGISRILKAMEIQGRESIAFLRSTARQADMQVIGAIPVNVPAEISQQTKNQSEMLSVLKEIRDELYEPPAAAEPEEPEPELRSTLIRDTEIIVSKPWLGVALGKLGKKSPSPIDIRTAYDIIDNLYRGREIEF